MFYIFGLLIQSGSMITKDVPPRENHRSISGYFCNIHIGYGCNVHRWEKLNLRLQHLSLETRDIPNNKERSQLILFMLPYMAVITLECTVQHLYSGPSSYDRLDIRTTSVSTKILVLTYDQILSYDQHDVCKRQSEPRYACLWT
jgi:hypothetical protein